MSSRPSLESADLQGVWEAVRTRLERSGPDNRGRVRLPSLSPRGRHLLGALIDAPVQATVDLAALERALCGLGVGDSLPAALDDLGYPISSEHADRRASRRASQDARASARLEAATLPYPWASDWVDGMIRAGVFAGLDVDGAVRLVRDTRAVLGRLDQAAIDDAGDPLSRVDVAAEVLGSSHALDRGTRTEAAVTGALRHRFPGLDRRGLWAQAGVHLDLVSAPVLTWRLRVVGTTPLAGLLDRADALGIPVHLSQLALRAHPMVAVTGTDVLVAENPRIVEAAAQSASPLTVVALNGNPSGAARLLLDQLLASGAVLRYHGDFDAAGLRICARMQQIGLVPWRMDAVSYLAAVADAEAGGVRLPIDPHRAPPTPWDPELQVAFDRHHRVVHEERLLLQLLGTD